MSRLVAQREAIDLEFWEVSRRLDQYLQGDHSYTETVRAALYERQHAKHLRRPVPLVPALALELTPHYATTPIRVFFGSDSGEMIRKYDELGLHATIQQIARATAVQGTQIVLPLPVQSGERTWALHSLSPWECEVYADPSIPWDLTRARAVRLRVPRQVSDDWIDWDIAELVAAGVDLSDVSCHHEARIRSERGLASGVWASDGAPLYGPDRGLPLGEMPLALWRIGAPSVGRFWGPQPRYLLDAQVAVDLGMSAIEFKARYSSGQLYVASDSRGPDDKLPFGEDTALVLGTDERLENTPRPFDAVQYAKVIELYVSAFRLAVGLRPETYSGAAVTADAKLMELWTQGQLRADIQSALADGERSMARALAIVLGWRQGAGSAPLDVTGVSVRYSLPEPPRNPLQMAQALEMRMRAGVETAWQVVQREAREAGEQITRDEAKRRVAEARADWEAAQPVQGPNPSGT